MTALYSYVHAFDENGLPYRSCDKCDDTSKKRFGCGFDERFAGTSKFRAVDGIDYRGTCPAWWRMQPFVQEFVTLLKWRENLGHPLRLPNRYIEAVNTYDYHIALRDADRRREQK